MSMLFVCDMRFFCNFADVKLTIQISDVMALIGKKTADH